MNEEELITYNGKQYKFKELPPEVQDVLKDENNNGIPDRLEPKPDAPKDSTSFFSQSPTEQVKKQELNVETVTMSLLKKYFTTSSLFLAITFAAGIVIFILFYFAGVIIS